MANINRKRLAPGGRGTWEKGFVAHQTQSGKMIIAGLPMFDEHLVYDEKQLNHQFAVRDAALYASFAENQQAYIRIAEQRGVTAYTLAMDDWFGAPKVLQIDVDGWTGHPGEEIRVKARDNVMVANVVIVIRDAGGRIQETGEARQSEAGSAWWSYTTQSLVLITPYPMVQAIAFDLAGNRGSFTI